jgi:hypothetical protein
MARSWHGGTQLRLSLIVMGSACVAMSCRSAPDPARVKALLVVIPNATDVNLTAAGNAGSAESLFTNNGSRTRRHVSLETCSICGSTREKVNEGPWKILYESPNAAGHEHHWESGVSSSMQVNDGRVVLTRLRLALDVPSYACGAFVLQSQRLEPERTDYKWIVRTDGGSVLASGNAAVSTGLARQQSAVAFGPFHISWSGHDAGSGFVFYPRFPGAGRSSDDWELCVTDLTSFERLDAADSRFAYKTSPVD